MPQIIVYCDGLCEPNPGGVATWAWVAMINGQEVNHAYGYLGKGQGMTGNCSEYHAVVQALRRAQQKGVSITIYTDSKLVVQQVNGQWRCMKPHLIALRDEAAQLLKNTGSTLSWIPREKNWRADELSKLAYHNARKA